MNRRLIRVGFLLLPMSIGYLAIETAVGLVQCCLILCAVILTLTVYLNTGGRFILYLFGLRTGLDYMLASWSFAQASCRVYLWTLLLAGA